MTARPQLNEAGDLVAADAPEGARRVRVLSYFLPSAP
jgi:hypothetical protein